MAAEGGQVLLGSTAWGHTRESLLKSGNISCLGPTFLSLRIKEQSQGCVSSSVSMVASRVEKDAVSPPGVHPGLCATFASCGPRIDLSEEFTK